MKAHISGIRHTVPLLLSDALLTCIFPTSILWDDLFRHILWRRSGDDENKILESRIDDGMLDLRRNEDHDARTDQMSFAVQVHDSLSLENITNVFSGLVDMRLTIPLWLVAGNSKIEVFRPRG